MAGWLGRPKKKKKKKTAVKFAHRWIRSQAFKCTTFSAIMPKCLEDGCRSWVHDWGESQQKNLKPASRSRHLSAAPQAHSSDSVKKWHPWWGWGRRTRQFTGELAGPSRGIALNHAQLGLHAGGQRLTTPPLTARNNFSIWWSVIISLLLGRSLKNWIL